MRSRVPAASMDLFCFYRGRLLSERGLSDISKSKSAGKQGVKRHLSAVNTSEELKNR